MSGSFFCGLPEGVVGSVLHVRLVVLRLPGEFLDLLVSLRQTLPTHVDSSRGGGPRTGAARRPPARRTPDRQEHTLAPRWSARVRGAGPSAGVAGSGRRTRAAGPGPAARAPRAEPSPRARITPPWRSPSGLNMRRLPIALPSPCSATLTVRFCVADREVPHRRRVDPLRRGRARAWADRTTHWPALARRPTGPPRYSPAPARPSWSMTMSSRARSATRSSRRGPAPGEWDVATDQLELPCDFDTEPDSPLLRAAATRHGRRRRPAGRRTDEPHPHRRRRRRAGAAHRRLRADQHLDKVWLAPGFSYAERFIGTNGIGTALEGRGPAQVFGHEHYVDHLDDLACAGAPIWHPVNGKLLGVVDLTCWRPDAGRFMSTAVARIARQIENALLDQSGRARARSAARLPDRMPARPRRGAGRQPRPGDDERQRPRADRPHRPGHADRRGHRGAALRPPRCCSSTSPVGPSPACTAARAGPTATRPAAS